MQEAVLGGTLTATLPSAKLEFRRRFKLPNGTVLALGAGVAAETVGSGSRRRRRLKPFLGCQLQLDHGGGGSELLRALGMCSARGTGPCGLLAGSPPLLLL